MVFLSQKFTKVKATIRENANAWVLWRQSFRATQALFEELGAAFDTHREMYDFLNTHTAGKHQFVVYTEIRFYDDQPRPLISARTTELVETGAPPKPMIAEQFPTLQAYLGEKGAAHDAQQRNVAAIRNLGQLKQSLLETTADVFRPITETQRDSTEKIVKQAERAKREREQAQEVAAAEVQDALKALTLTVDSQAKEVQAAMPLTDVVKRYLRADGRDEVFGLSHEAQNKFVFGAMHQFRDAGKLIEESLLELFQDTEGAWFVGARRGPDSLDLPLSEDLLALLTLDTVSTNQNANSQYMRLVKLCLGPELRALV